MSAFHHAFVKPACLGIGVLAFGTAGSVAWRGAAYLFGGMAGEGKMERMAGTARSDDDGTAVPFLSWEHRLWSNAGRLRQEVERLRLAWNFGGAVKSCLADRWYAESCLVGRCYARQISRSLRIWTDERRVVVPFGAVVASMDVWTGMDDADLFPEDGSVVR
ncbi:Serine/threonine-protein kinase HT1 [Hordeum vulgare]|nr:Serine/threonine-protein kinase HT1 [Hordeum vulgare]